MGDRARVGLECPAATGAVDRRGVLEVLPAPADPRNVVQASSSSYAPSPRELASAQSVVTPFRGPVGGAGQ